MGSSICEVPEKNPVIQRSMFGKSSRINLTTRKSSVEKVRNAEIGAKSSGIESASSVPMAAFDKLVDAREEVSGDESLPSELAVVFTAVAAATAAPVPADETQLPSESQNRPRHTCRMDHGSHPNQTNPTIKNRAHLSTPRALWMTI